MFSPFARTAITLGLLAAVGPFAIDSYLPALPAISADLQASASATKMTLTAFFAAFGLSQLVYGPVCDSLGRKPPLYFGLGLFVVGTLGCALAPSIAWLMGWRFIQGVGAASVMVIPRAIIRDLYTGVEATRMMSQIMLVISISPILAPTFGGWLILAFGWRAIFLFSIIVALASMTLTRVALPETLPPERRVAGDVATIFTNCRTLVGHRRFLGLTFIGAFGMASFFAFLSGSSFIYIKHFGLSPAQYGMAFGFNAIGFFAASQLSAPMSARFGAEQAIMMAVSGYLAGALLLFCVTLAGEPNLSVLMVLLALCFACLGLVLPLTMVLALDDQGPIAGMASALGGTLQMLTGALVILIASLAPEGSILSMTSVILVCALLAFAISRATLARATSMAPAQ